MYAVASLCVIASSITLWWLLLTDCFDVKYVHDFSSRAQPLVYKLSAFWGGQEGSWLIWLTWICVAGLFLLKRAGKYEPPAMAFWSSLQVFFLIVAVQRSPFAATARPVTDGAGLNPLLQNYWMAIHPPIVFAGFTLMSVPAAFAVAALVQNDYRNWARMVFGWALLGFTVLGAGVLLGGVWAYETLGWGGWWGWDPVENASLVPWLFGGALVHGLMLERTKRTWKRVNLLLAIASFVLVIYATFLTRSGVLGDFSVHSFASLGNNNWLLGFLIAYTALGIGLVAWRTRSLSRHDAADAISPREFVVFMGILLFGLAAVLVTVGMSSPLLSRGLTGKAGNVPVDYYYRVTTPVALAMMALVGASPLLSWARARRAHSRQNWPWVVALAVALAIGLAAGLAVWRASGAEAGARLVVGWFAVIILVPGLWSLADTVRLRGLRVAGGHISHLGFSIFFLGMLAASHNNKAEPDRLVLEEGKGRTHLGMTWTFLGLGETASDGRQPFRIVVRKPSGDSFVATPTIQEVRDGSTMRHPYIRKSLIGDLYVAPVEVQVAQAPPQAVAARGKDARVGPYVVRFLGFTPMQTLDDGSMRAGARLSVSGKGFDSARSMSASVRVDGRGMHYEAAPIPGAPDSILLTAMSISGSSVSLMLDGPSWRSQMRLQAIVEVTHKPLVWTLWLGAAIMALGGGISTARRIADSRRKPNQEAQDGIGPPAEDSSGCAQETREPVAR